MLDIVHRDLKLSNILLNIRRIKKEKNHSYKIEDFIKIKELGKGNFGKVLWVKNKFKEKYYARN